MKSEWRRNPKEPGPHQGVNWERGEIDLGMTSPASPGSEWARKGEVGGELPRCIKEKKETPWFWEAP